MKRSLILGLCGLVVASVSPVAVNADPNGKEEYMVLDTGYERTSAPELTEILNAKAKEGWKVRAANEYLNNNHTLSMFVILYREIQ